MSTPYISDYEAFICSCGDRLETPQNSDMTFEEWRRLPEVTVWMLRHREHAGCTGISVMFGIRRRIEQLDPDQIALSLVEELSFVDESEYWQTQHSTRRKAEKQVRLAKMISELKTYLAGSI